MNGFAASARGLAGLRRMAMPRPAEERCELCAAPVGEQHRHLIDPEARRLLCACDACALLFDHAAARRYRRVPRDVRALTGFDLDDALWNSLAIPIGLAFLFRSSVTRSVLAVYPSPGGPAETAVEEETWKEVAALDASISRMEDDVEALLVNRVQGVRAYYIVPIDQCYKLTGVIRTHWRGFSGGERLWEELRHFFDSLNRSAIDA
jgi:hypothetical protein